MSNMPRSTAQILGTISMHEKALRGPAEYWADLNRLRLHAELQDALTAAGLEPAKAHEIAESARAMIFGIASDLENAVYRLRELTGELEDARRLTRRSAYTAGFQV